MPYYEDINVLFLHIPKTGGRMLEGKLSNISKQTLNLSNAPYSHGLPHNLRHIAVQHQVYSTIYEYRDLFKINFDNNLKVFSVVRNPYTRIMSDLFFLGKIKRNYDKEQVCDVIKNNYMFLDSTLDNHKIPQYKFVTDENENLIPHIKIFRNESLAEDNEELNNFLGISIDIKKIDTTKNYMSYLNEESIKLINEFYEKDFKIFGYKKICV